LLKSFVEGATKKLQELESLVKETEEKFKKVLKYYGEQPTMDTHDFFELIIGFVSAVDRTKKDIIKRKQADEKAVKAAEIDAKKKAAKAAKVAAGGDQPKGVLDNLIDDMKSGEAFANKPKPGFGRGRAMIPPGGPGGKPGANVANEALLMFSKFKAKNAP